MKFLIIILIIMSSTMKGVETTKLHIEETGYIGYEEINNKNSNVNFQNNISIDAVAENQVILNGSGVTAGDYDKDGMIDIYFAGLEKNNKLYKNLGNFKFVDVTTKILSLDEFESTAVAFADINGDTWLDLIIGTINSGLVILQNNKGKSFKRINHNINIDNESSIYGIALTDIEHDGDLDMYISTYRNYSVRSNNNIIFETKFIGGKQVIDYGINPKTNTKIPGNRFHISENGKIFEMGVFDYLFLNNNGQYENANIINTIEDDSNFYRKRKNWGLGCIFADLNQDYYDDLYVCNDLDGGDYILKYDIESNKYAFNNGVLNYNSPMFSMGVDVADVNNDTLMDIFVVDMLNRNFQSRKKQIRHNPEYINLETGMGYENNRNMLFQANSINKYDEISQYAGIDSSDWSWTALFTDINLDGLQDILITNGFGYDLENINLEAENEKSRNTNLSYFDRRVFNKKYVKSDTNYAFKNDGNSKFIDQSKKWGFNKNGISHGACLADLDNDGDEDIIVNNFGLYIPGTTVLGTYLPKIEICESTASIYNNKCSKPRIKVTVRLDGNTHGIGSVVKFIQNKNIQTRQIRAGSRYCSSDEYSLTFSYDIESDINILEVNLGGRQARHKNVVGNKTYEFNDKDFKFFEGDKNDKSIKINKKNIGLHNPNKINTDIFQKNIGKEVHLSEPIINTIHDKILYSANNKIDSNARFKEKLNIDNQYTIKDSFTLQHKNQNYVFILSEKINFINEEQNSKITCYKNSDDEYYKFDEFLLKKSYSCINWMAKDSDSLVIILGGNVILGRYPKGFGADYFVLKIGDKQLVNTDVKNIFNNTSVNDICISDLNSDGNYEAIFANEANEINIYTYTNDDFTKYNFHEIPKLISNWKSILVTDYDNDGDKDIIVSNEGENNQYTKYNNLNLYLVNHNSDYTIYRGVDMEDKIIPIHHLDYYSNFNPYLKVMYKTNKEFEENFVNLIKNSYHVKFNTHSTILLLNERNKFIVTKLPDKVNYYSNISMLSIDLDLNGYYDILFARNCFENKEENEKITNIPLLVLLKDESGHIVKELDIQNNSRTLAYSDYNNDCIPDIILGNYGSRYNIISSTNNNKCIKLNFDNDDLKMFGTTFRLIFKNGKKGGIHEVTNRRTYRAESERSLIFAADGVEKIEIKNKVISKNITITEDNIVNIEL